MRETITYIRHSLQEIYPSGELQALIRIIMESVCGLTTCQLLVGKDRDLSAKERSKIEEIVVGLRQQQPIKYLLGEALFHGMTLKVTPAVLIPRPETAELVDLVLQDWPAESSPHLLDVGTGSGCIAITLALEMPELAVTATDFSEKALAVAKDNAETLKARISFHQGSWYEALPDDARFDIIVSNPPYIHPQDHHLANLRYEPITALTDGVDGLKDLRAIVTDAPNHLNANGLLAMEHGWDKGEAVRNLFDESLWYDVRTIKDLGDNDRVTLGRLKS